MKIIEDEGKTAVLISVDGKVAGIIGISDKLKPESKETIVMLNKMGIEVWMVTGDNGRTAKAIGKQVS